MIPDASWRPFEFRNLHVADVLHQRAQHLERLVDRLADLAVQVAQVVLGDAEHDSLAAGAERLHEALEPRLGPES